jgi:hypothetical protein
MVVNKLNGYLYQELKKLVGNIRTIRKKTILIIFIICIYLASQLNLLGKSAYIMLFVISLTMIGTIVILWIILKKCWIYMKNRESKTSNQ